MTHISKKIFCVFSLISISLIIGCGSSSNVKKGDMFELLSDLKISADIQGSTEFSDGFVCYIPKGATLEAAYNINSSGFFECVIVKTPSSSDFEAVKKELVPEAVSNREGFQTFTVTFNKSAIGTTLKKLD